MIISLSPQRKDTTLTASLSGDMLTLNGVIEIALGLVEPD